jgi:hypothetical protein
MGFYPDVAPVTVAHILKLARLGAYNTNHFFRVRPSKERERERSGGFRFPAAERQPTGREGLGLAYPADTSITNLAPSVLFPPSAVRPPRLCSRRRPPLTPRCGWVGGRWIKDSWRR